jgi:hypothetical protein
MSQSFVFLAHLGQPDQLIAVLDIEADGTGYIRTCCGMTDLSAEDLARLRAFLAE